ncbi:hypothetical protein [Rickettsiella endosymbiont of Dermanyssus gallinae]|uniref:hypothetical protein n=1 Tax=Rickettsiella endosymbiont of Dermanyssus gallinae TaxID=2856608 RepID=UPI001C533F40|nr:hypothetical protein [Rickettsiella endosymbiont of Dermanyssus gallinae]
MRYKGKTIVFIELFWLALLLVFTSLVYLNQEFIGLFFNSDSLMFPSVFKNLFLQHGHYKDWSLSPAPHFFPDFLIFFPVFLVFKDVYFQFLAVLCLQLILLYLAVKYTYLQLFTKNKAIIYALSSVSIFYLFSCRNISPYELAMIPAAHMGEFIMGLFFIGIQLNLINNTDPYKGKSLFFIGILLSFLCSLSDLLFLVQFSSAAFVAYFFLYVNKGIKFKFAFYYACIPFIAAVIAALLTKHIVPTDVLSSYLDNPSLNTISLSSLHKQWLQLIQLFKTNVNGFLWGILVVFYTGTFISLFRVIFNKKNGDDLHSKEQYLSYFIIFSSLLAIISIFLVSKENYVLDRYMFSVFFLPVLLFFYLNCLFVNIKAIYNGLAWLGAVFFLLLIFNIKLLLSKPGFKVKLSYYPSFIACIDQALRGYGHKGIAQYWDANLISMLSKTSLDLVPVSSNLVAFPNAINLKKFVPAYSFAIVNTSVLPALRLDEKFIQGVNGQAKKVVVCEDRKILIYPQDTLKVPFFEKKQDQFTWQAAFLPSQFLKSEISDSRQATEKDAVGYLTFGPYITLPAGHYSFAIVYSSDALVNRQVGTWDSVLAKRGMIFSSGPLMGTEGKLTELKASLRVPLDLANNNFEIRTLFLGHANLQVKRITLIKD